MVGWEIRVGGASLVEGFEEEREEVELRISEGAKRGVSGGMRKRV